MSKQYYIFTDGGCRNTGNVKNEHVKQTNKSAYAYLITNHNHHKICNGTQGFYGKTNNQMEISGVVFALIEVLASNHFNQATDTFKVISDSKYVDNSMNKHWIKNWHKQHFYRRQNSDLWNVLLILSKHFHHLSFQWVKGHGNGKTFASRGNIYVDHLLNKTMDKLKNK